MLLGWEEPRRERDGLGASGWDAALTDVQSPVGHCKGFDFSSEMGNL